MSNYLAKTAALWGVLLFVSGALIHGDANKTTGKVKVGRRTLPVEEFEDKVRGGWAGQMIGVTYGAPTEFRYLQRINEDPREWQPKELAGALDQDDLYVEMTFAEVMDRRGVDATTEEYGKAFMDSKYRLWHANLAARRLLRRGVAAPMSGHPDHNLHANDIDFQIESDFIGLMCPGLPRAAQRYADRVGRVMNYGDGLYGGVFISAMYAAAFFEKSPRRIVVAGLAAIPRESIYAQTIRDVLNWSAKYSDWKKTWRMVEDKWDKDDPCPEGALRPFNIDASLNGAYVALGLLYGKGDFNRTIDIAMRSGQDSDCNPASAGGIIGTMIGYRAIPKKWTDPLPALADKKFSYTNYSFNSIVASTLGRAKRVVAQEGGRATGTGLEIPYQKPQTLPLEQFRPGSVMDRIPFSDPRWKWPGRWRIGSGGASDMRSRTAGAEARVSFEGTGAMLVGTLRPDGGSAEVYLDGQLMGTLDAFNDDGERRSEGLWGKFNLKDGPHTIRVLVKGKPYPGSTDAWIYLESLIVYRKMPPISTKSRTASF